MQMNLVKSTELFEQEFMLGRGLVTATEKVGLRAA
jgi:hypothetical protein